MIDFIKKHPISIAIVLLALTQVPDFIAKSNFNRCVSQTYNSGKNIKSQTPRFAYFKAVHRCNGGSGF